MDGRCYCFVSSHCRANSTYAIVGVLQSYPSGAIRGTYAYATITCMGNVLIIDNYDSFTFNLVNYFKRAGADSVWVVRNDEIETHAIASRSITHIVISPGAGTPDDAGISMEVIRTFSGKIPILGVCLGLQVIVQAWGGRIIHASRIMHGKVDTIMHDGKRLYRTFTAPIVATRYHSLCADPSTLPACLEVTAHSADGHIMGLRHVDHATEGIQFHPESIGTEEGLILIRNFLAYESEHYSIKECLGMLSRKEHLGSRRAAFVAREVSNNVLKDTQIAALIMGITSLGIREEELLGFARVFLNKARCIVLDSHIGRRTIDIVGTGGDGLKTCNISTLASITLASLISGLGYKVAKHGNRSVSSNSGSSDVLSQLGYPMNATAHTVQSFLEEYGFAFLFAPLYHSTFKHLAEVRKDIGVFTIMNFLGPLLNPINVGVQLLGVSQQNMCEPMLKTALRLGRERVWVVRGEDGMDEVSVCAPTEIYSISQDGHAQVERHILTPSDMALASHSVEDLVVRDACHSADVAKACLQGKAQEAVIDAVAANAGLAHALAISNSVESIPESVEKVKAFLQSGKVWDYFESVCTAMTSHDSSPSNR